MLLRRAGPVRSRPSALPPQGVVGAAHALDVVFQRLGILPRKLLKQRIILHRKWKGVRGLVVSQPLCSMRQGARPQPATAIRVCSDHIQSHQAREAACCLSTSTRKLHPANEQPLQYTCSSHSPTCTMLATNATNQI